MNLTDFGDLYARLKVGGSSEARKIYSELLSLEETDEVREWLRFWRGRQSIVERAAAPELVFLALAESYAEAHPITLAAERWLQQSGPERAWLKLRFRPAQPVEMPLAIRLPPLPERQYARGVRLEPDGERVAVSNPEGWWDVRSGQASPPPPGPSDALYEVRFEKGSSLLVLREGEVLNRWTVEGFYPWEPPRISRDGRWVLCLTHKGGNNDLAGWELDEHGRVVREHSGTRKPWGAVWATSERRCLVHAGGGQLELWDRTADRLLARIPEGPEHAWSGPWLWNGRHCWDMERACPVESDDTLEIQVEPGRVRVLHKPSGSALADLYRGQLYARYFCPDRLLAYGEGYCHGRWGEPLLLDLKTGLQRRVPQPPAKPAGGKFCDRHLVVCNQEGDFRESSAIRIYDLDTLTRQRRLRIPPPCAPLDATPDARLVAAACEDGLLRIFDCSAPQAEPPMWEHDSTIRILVMTPDGRRLASGSTDKTARVYDLESGSCLGVFEGGNAWTTPGLSDDGRWLFVSSARGQWLYDLQDGRLVAQGELYLSSDGLVVSLEDNELRVTRALDGGLVTTYRHSHRVTACAVSPHGARVVSGDAAGDLHHWDLHTGERLHRVDGGGRPIYEISWRAHDRVRYFPKTDSNFWYRWRFGENPRREEGERSALPSNYSSTSGTSPGGAWTFELTSDGVLLRSSQETLSWPDLAPPRCALFRSDDELLVGMSTGEILSLQLMPAGRRVKSSSSFGCLPFAEFAPCSRILVLAAADEQDLEVAARLAELLPGSFLAAPLAKARPGVSAFRAAGPEALFLRLKELVPFDGLVLVDCGCRSLLRGDEPELAQPALPLSMLAAAYKLHLKAKMLLGCGFGRFPLCHAHILEAASELTRLGAFRGAYALPESGADPLRGMWWFFGLDAVAERCRALAWIAEKSSLRDVNRALANFRSTVKPREWEKILM